MMQPPYDWLVRTDEIDKKTSVFCRHLGVETISRANGWTTLKCGTPIRRRVVQLYWARQHGAELGQGEKS
jgi:hypothetical protein